MFVATLQERRRRLSPRAPRQIVTHASTEAIAKPPARPSRRVAQSVLPTRLRTSTMQRDVLAREDREPEGVRDGRDGHGVEIGRQRVDEVAHRSGEQAGAQGGPGETIRTRAGPRRSGTRALRPRSRRHAPSGRRSPPPRPRRSRSARAPRWQRAALRRWRPRHVASPPMIGAASAFWKRSASGGEGESRQAAPGRSLARLDHCVRMYATRPQLGSGESSIGSRSRSGWM